MLRQSESTSYIVLFDGYCNLCTGSVQFIIKRDPDARFRFASLQSEEAEALLKPVDRSTEAFDSVVLIEDDRIYTKSEAALRIASRLKGLWSLTKVFLVVPRKIRDAVYDWIARNRKLWFGSRKECWLPTGELKSRFIGGEK